MYSQNLPLLEREGHALGRKKMQGVKKTLFISGKKEHLVSETTMLCSTEASFVNTSLSRIHVCTFMNPRLRKLSVNH